MKRRPHGVNLDDGVALFSEEELSLLFVDARPEARARLLDWLGDDGQGAVLFAGQIGTGKTTLLNQVLRSRNGVAGHGSVAHADRRPCCRGEGCAG